MSDIRKYFGKGQQARETRSKNPSRKRVINDSDEEVEVIENTKPSPVGQSTAAIQVEPEEFFGTTKISKRLRERPVKKQPAQDEDYGEFEFDEDDLKILAADPQGLPDPAHSRPAKNISAPQSPVTRPEKTRKRKLPVEAPVDPSAADAVLDHDANSTASKKVKRGHAGDGQSRSDKVLDLESTVKQNVSQSRNSEVIESSAQILNSIPLVALPEPGEAVTFKFGQQAPSVAAPGSKPIPEGADGCLSGLTFVFTGVLSSIERTEAQDLVKKYGGKVTTAPSKNTSFVVLGEQAGPSKIKKIAQLGIKVIDEDGLLNLISSMPAQGGDNLAAQKAVEKRAAEEKKAKDAAVEMAQLEARQKKQNEEKLRKAVSTGDNPKIIDASEQLWTAKYAPIVVKDLIGNKSNIDKLTRFLSEWPKNLKAKFRKPGPDGLGLYRAVLISGAPGIGKTTSAHMVARLAGFDIVEFNASDTRSKKLLEEGLKGVVNNSSLNGYFGAGKLDADVGKKRLVLIMDEVDGMSAGDRGGVGALNAVIRKTSIPIICICNDRSSQKLKPLDKTTFDLRYTKPTKDQVRSRIMSIAFKEGLNISPVAIDQLVESTGSDIRQIINLLSTYRLTKLAMNQDQSQAGAKSAEKHVVLKPWDIVGRFLNGAMYNERSKVSLNEKIELYFNDHDMSYLMVQENYLNTNPDRARTAGGPKEQQTKRLQLACKAAGAISDGDLVDAMIHGSQQHWSLMPIHAVFSCVRPASMIAGPGGRPNFTSVLGNMSKLNKANRLLREVRAHLRLKTSGDRHEIRRDYIPTLFNKIPKALELGGADAIPQIIETMDEYFLNKDDYDSLLDLGIGDNNREQLDGRIASAVKSAFTRQYNKAAHPTAFIPSAAGPPAKKMAAADVPDFEDAVDLSEDEQVVEKEEDSSDDDSPIDLKKEKFIQAPKKGKSTKVAAAKVSKARTTKKK